MKKMTKSLVLSSLLLGLTFLQINASYAEEIKIPVSQQGNPTTQTPARGITQEKVTEKFGSPVAMHAPIGEPPISKWEYQDFYVFFEHDRVIHSVIKKQAKQ